jgi:putative membrane protein
VTLVAAPSLVPQIVLLEGNIMNRKTPFWRNFNWRILLLRILINAAALFLTAALVPDIYFVDRSLLSLLLLALGLGVLNAFVKPILQVLTLRFIFASYGFIVILINTLILYLLAFFFPERFAVDHFLWAFVGGALIGAIGSLLESLLGVTAPIVGDRYPYVRTKIKEEQGRGLEARLAQPLTPSAPLAAVEESDATAAEAAEAPAEAGSAAGPIDAGAQVAAGGEA